MYNICILPIIVVLIFFYYSMHGATADKKASEPNSEGATVNLLEIKLINYVGWRYESCGILNQNPA